MASTDFSDHEEEEMKQLLLQAAISGDLRLLKEMAKSLDKGKGIAETIKEIRCSKGLCALHHAAAAGETGICQWLIEELGIPVDICYSSSRSSTYGELVGGTPLLYAAKEGRSVTVNYLIEQGADPIATDNEFSTPLLYAAACGHAKVVKLLLSKRVPVDSEGHRGTRLHQAASYGQESIMKILLHHGADVNRLKHGHFTPLLCTVMAGSLNCTKLLIKMPLALAVHENKMEMVRCLLDVGADPNIPMEDGKLLIEVATIVGSTEMVKIPFPLTSPIPDVKYLSLEGLYIRFSCVAFQKKIGMMSQKKIFDLNMKGGDAFKRKDFLTAVVFYELAIGLDKNHKTDATLFANKSLCWVKAGYGERALEVVILLELLTRIASENISALFPAR